MRFKNIELFIVGFFLLISFAEFIPYLFTFRILGQNVTNPRAWLYASIIVVFVNDRRSFFSTSMLWVYAYFAIYLLLEAFGHYDLSGFGKTSRFAWFKDQHFAIGIAILFREYYFRPEKIAELKSLLKLSTYTILAISALSIYLIYRYPGAVRGNEQQLFSEEINNVRKFGLGSYTFFSSLPLFISALVYQYKDKLSKIKRLPVLLLLSIAVVVFCSYKAVIVAPFLLSVIVLLFSSLGRKRYRANLTIVVLLLMIYVVVPKGIIGRVFYEVASVTPNRDISLKLNEIGQAFTEGIELVTYDEQANTGIEGRASRLRYNLNDFYRSPLIGNGIESNAHIYWLNLLAQFGLLGVIPLIMILQGQIRKNLRLFSEQTTFYYAIMMLAFVTLGFMKAMGGYAMFLIPFFVVPGIFYVHDLSPGALQGQHINAFLG